MSVYPNVRPYLQLLRLPATFSAWSNVIAAHVIATGAEPRWEHLGLQIGISSLLYWSGMVLNDCFDFAEDRLERPARPLPSGQVSAGVAWSLGWGLMSLGLGLAAVAGWRALAISLPLALWILAYDGMLKGGPLGPAAMGLCRYLNWLLGLAALPLAATNLLLPLPVFLYTAAVTVLSGTETHGAERRTTGVAAALLGLAALAILVFFAVGLLGDPWLVAALAAALYPMVKGLQLMQSEGTPAAVQSMVRLLLLGMIPLDALLLAGNGHWPAALALLLLVLPGRWIGRALYVT